MGPNLNLDMQVNARINGLAQRGHGTRSNRDRSRELTDTLTRDAKSKR